MTRTLKTFLMLALFAFVAPGCDQNAFDEDYPDPETEGLGPYVAFDAIGIQNDLSGTFDPNATNRGVTFAVNQNRNREFDLEVRIPAAIGEDVNITYQLSGTAVEGVDYLISGTPGQLTIDFQDDSNLTDNESFQTDLTINTLAAPAGRAQRTLTITLTGATSESGQTFTLGRLPDGRDRSVTLLFNAPAA